MFSSDGEALIPGAAKTKGHTTPETSQTHRRNPKISRGTILT